MPTFAEIIKKKEKDWNAPNMMNAAKQYNTDKIPFSSPLMNWSTYGGVPMYRATEFFGEPGSGKSTSAVDCLLQDDMPTRQNNGNSHIPP